MVSDEQLIQDLEALGEELGETPTGRQMSEDGPWNSATYRRHFGSWNKALKEAGFEPVQEHSGSKEKLLEDLQEFADELGEIPTCDKMNKYGPWSETTYKNQFGSWNRALDVADLDKNNEYSIPKEKLIEDLQAFADELGETPTQKQMVEDGPWSRTPYKNRFGSWNQALHSARLELNEEKQYPESKEELIEDLQEFVDELDEIPTQKQMSEDGPWSKDIYRDSFGSWNEALKEAGFEPIQEYPVEPAWGDDVEDYYGESWPEMRAKAVQRDDEQCRVCGDDELIHVHHIKPRRCFEDPDESNTLDNLITLCVSCHGRFENRWTDTDPDEFEAKARELLSVA